MGGIAMVLQDLEIKCDGHSGQLMQRQLVGYLRNVDDKLRIRKASTIRRTQLCILPHNWKSATTTTVEDALGSDLGLLLYD